MNGIWIIVIILFALSAALLIASFFKTDSSNQFQEEVEEMSLDILRDIQLLKDRVTVLEKELNVEAPEEDLSERVLDLTKNQIVKLYTRGLTVPEIAERLSMADSTVQSIIDGYIAEGMA